jgi:acyl dehydratase
MTALYAKAIASALPEPFAPSRSAASDDAEPFGVRLARVCLDPDRLSAYREVCGFAGDDIPATYPQLLAFPLQLVVMTDQVFPFAPLGVIHIGNTINQHRPLAAGEPLDLTVTHGPPEPHPRGRLVALRTQARANDEIVWEAEAVMLSRERRPVPTAEDAPDRAAAAQGSTLPDEAPSGPQVWRLPSNLGRRYAAVSGDRNPIHLYDLTARPFGFSRHIAHGMWTKARCLAELQNRLPDAFRVEVSFRKPVTLPSSVTFGARDHDGHTDFGIASATSGSAHLVGRITGRNGG